MRPTWVLSAPDGPHVGPMILAIRDVAPVTCRSCRSLRVYVMTLVTAMAHQDFPRVGTLVCSFRKRRTNKMVQYKYRLYSHKDFHYNDKIFILRWPPERYIKFRYITVLSCRPETSFTSTFMKMSPLITLISDDAVVLKLIHLPMSCCFIFRKRTAMYHVRFAE